MASDAQLKAAIDNAEDLSLRQYFAYKAAGEDLEDVTIIVPLKLDGDEIIAYFYDTEEKEGYIEDIYAKRLQGSDRVTFASDMKCYADDDWAQTLGIDALAFAYGIHDGDRSDILKTYEDYKKDGITHSDLKDIRKIVFDHYYDAETPHSRAERAMFLEKLDKAIDLTDAIDDFKEKIKEAINDELELEDYQSLIHRVDNRSDVVLDTNSNNLQIKPN